MKKVFLAIVLFSYFFMPMGCTSKKDKNKVMRTSFVPQKLGTSDITNTTNNNSVPGTPSIVTPVDIKTVASDIINKYDYLFNITNVQDTAQNIDSHVALIETIYVLGAEADYLYDSFQGLLAAPQTALYNEGSAYDSTRQRVHNIALGKVDCVSQTVTNLFLSALLAGEVARDVIVASWNAVRSHDEQVQDIARAQRDIKVALQTLNEVILYVNSGNSEGQRIQHVLNNTNTILNTANNGNKAQNITWFTRLFKMRGIDQRVDLDTIYHDLNNALARADINTVVNQLNTIINDQNLAEFISSINQLAQLLNN